jgi:para-nitrobenzyl esterase
LKDTVIINTMTGKIRGYTEDGLQIFKGIPYAEPPIGDLRLRDTVPKEPWDGILEAKEFGPIAPQPILEPSSFVGHPQNEDCLTLNIWTPPGVNTKHPVMFWIHGGAFYFGGTPNPSYRGKFLSKIGDLCVVTINYRLGSLGNLYVPDKVSNLGFLDQVTALKWVHENIVNFGGDPNNITIFGESAGSQSFIELLPRVEVLILEVTNQREEYGPLKEFFQNWVLKWVTLMNSVRFLLINCLKLRMKYVWKP